MGQTKRNYDREMEAVLDLLRSDTCVPRLLLHSCCAPCSSAVLERLSPDFSITVFYYNPNITDEAEYRHRVAEERRLIGEFPSVRPIDLVEGSYDPERFFEIAQGLEDVPEGGERCRKCFALRLEETAKRAARDGYDFFTTTLSISPMKDAAALNEIGERIAASYDGLTFLPSDFKKRDGYKRSLELSREYDLYRQDYCGCEYSRNEREKQKKEHAPRGAAFD